jgi:predicted amidohydrolase
MKLALVQFEIAWEQPELNARRVRQLLDQANGPLDLILLPELWSVGFSMNPNLFFYEAETLKAMGALAQSFNAHIIGGCPARNETGSPLNRLIWMNRQGTLQGAYDKQKRFPLAGEHEVFAAGSEPAPLWRVEGWTIRPLICYELRFPHLLERTEANALVDMVVVAANWPSRRRLHWQTLLQARAIEQVCFVAGVNRLGQDNQGLEHSGDSGVFSPNGLMAELPSAQSGLIEVALKRSQLEAFRRQFPFLSDGPSPGGA